MHGRISTSVLVLGLLGFAACLPSDREDKEDVEDQTQPLAGEVSLWATGATPQNPSDQDRAAVELGVRFRTDVAGKLAGIRYYKSAANTGRHTAHLWSNTGTLLASATFTSESASGWQTVRFGSPVTLVAGATYVASYHTDVGRYAGDTSYFKGRSVDSGPLHALADGQGGANGVYRYGATAFPNQTYQSTNYWVDVVFAPAAATADAGAPQPDSGTPAQDSGTTVPPPATGGWPGAANTGVPAGTTLTPYTGPCVITTANTVIDSKTINCNLEIKAAGVKITRSRIIGTVSTDENSTGYSFTLSDSEVDAGNKPGTGVGAVNFTALRVHVRGGNRSMHCWKNCTIQDSYVHGQMTDPTGVYHESGIRMGQGATIRHNTIACDAPDVPPDAGCSAALTGYGDFGPVQNNTIDNNLIKANSGGYCAYGGSSKGKPYSSETNNIVFTRNVFERGSSGKCGYYGAITSFDSAEPGNVWSANTWSDGAVLPPSN